MDELNLPFRVVDANGRHWDVFDELIFIDKHGEAEAARLLGTSLESVQKYKKAIDEWFKNKKKIYHEMPGGRLVLKSRGHRKQRQNADPEELRTYLQEHNLGCRPAARIAGINPETLKRAMKPKGEHGHRPISSRIFNRLMIRVEHLDVASEMETNNSVMAFSSTRESRGEIAQRYREWRRNQRAFREELEQNVKRTVADCIAHMEVESPAF